MRFCSKLIFSLTGSGHPPPAPQRPLLIPGGVPFPSPRPPPLPGPVLLGLRRNSSVPWLTVVVPPCRSSLLISRMTQGLAPWAVSVVRRFWMGGWRPQWGRTPAAPLTLAGPWRIWPHLSSCLISSLKGSTPPLPCYPSVFNLKAPSSRAPSPRFQELWLHRELGVLWWPRGVAWEGGLRGKGHMYIVVIVAELLSCIGLFCDPMDCSPPGSSVHGISQARILEWVAISLSRGSSQPRDWTCIGRQILYHWAIREALDICILTAVSHHCTVETNTTLESNYPPIKKKRKGGGLDPSLYLILRPKPPLPFLQILIRQVSFSAQHEIVLGSLSWFSHCWL